MTNPQPICEKCKDTHKMPAWNESGDIWPCTFCPRPCQRCRESGVGAYCGTTPCMCDCHKDDHQYKKFFERQEPVRRPTLDEVADYIERRMKAARADRNHESAGAYEIALDFVRNGAFNVIDDPHVAMAKKAMEAMTRPPDPGDLPLLAGLFRAHATYEAGRGSSPWPFWGTCAVCPTDPNNNKRPWECPNNLRGDHRLEVRYRKKS